ncbi:MAG: hypothetical protein A2W23_08800 [Planctomycetes bacterium RBG_16_43_13]|nr:MAG: hypothetical protein A2W23_08800 [Planctomycetes bacterium RBG_16_43_13]
MINWLKRQTILCALLMIGSIISITCSTTSAQDSNNGKTEESKEELKKLLTTENLTIENRKDIAKRLMKSKFGKELLQEAVKSTDAGLRKDIAGVLGKIPEEWAQEELINLTLNDSERDVRIEAVRGLGHHKNKKSVKALAQVLKNEKDKNVRRQSAIELGELKDGDGIEPLIEVIEEDVNKDNLDVRYYCIEALGEIGSKKVLPALYSILRKGTWGIEAGMHNAYYLDAAIEALAKINAPETPTEITKILLGDNKWKDNMPKEFEGSPNAIGEHIIEFGLKYIGNPWASTVLDEVIKNSKDQELINTAKKVKDEIAKEQQKRKEEEQKKEKQEKK